MLQAVINGSFGGQPYNHLVGGARIANQLRIFKDHLQAEIARQLAAFTDDKLHHCIHNVYGVDGFMLIAEKAFKVIIPGIIR